MESGAYIIFHVKSQTFWISFPETGNVSIIEKIQAVTKVALGFLIQ